MPRLAKWSSLLKGSCPFTSVCWYTAATYVNTISAISRPLPPARKVVSQCLLFKYVVRLILLIFNPKRWATVASAPRKCKQDTYSML